MITLYSTGCPKCKVLEQKMGQKNIQYNVVQDEDKVVEFGIVNNIRSAPLLDIDGKAFDFIAALNWVREQ